MKQEYIDNRNIDCPIVDSYNKTITLLVESGQNGSTGVGRFEVIEHLVDTGLVERIGSRGWDQGYVQTVYRLVQYKGLPPADKVYESTYTKKTNLVHVKEIKWPSK